MRLDERSDFDLAVEDEIECGGIELGRTTPISEGARIERHQIRKPHLDLVHRETDDGERRAVDEQPERRELTSGGSRALEDEPFRQRESAFAGERSNRRFERARVLLGRVERERNPVLR